MHIHDPFIYLYPNQYKIHKMDNEKYIKIYIQHFHIHHIYL